MDVQPIKLGTRGSKLALAQAQHVKTLLEETQKRPVEIIVIETSGDRDLDSPLPEIGGKGVFTQELEEKLLNKEIDGAVHSLKDLPTELPDDLTIGACLHRDTSADALVFPAEASFGMLEELPRGFRIGTSAVRRKALITHYNSNLQPVELRGNIDTRVNKLLDGQCDALCLSLAGLQRLGFDQDARIRILALPERYFLPAVAQGCVAVECKNQKDILKIFKRIEDPTTEVCVRMERELLSGLGGGCSVPLGVHSEVETGEFILNGILFSDDCSDFVTLSGSTRDLSDRDFIPNLIYEIRERGKGHLLGEKT